MSQAGSIGSGGGGGGGATDFVADMGAATPSSGEIDLLGGTLINTSAAGNIVTFNADDTVVASVVTDSGTCTPASNAFNLLGGTGIDTSAVGDTITITFDGSEDPEIPTSFPTDSGTATPALNALTVSGGNFVNTSGTGAAVTINADTTLASTFATDSGTATAATNGITVTGGTGIDTSGATSVVTINAAATVPLSFNTDGSAATPAANAVTIAGGTGITTSGSGSTVTVDLDNPVTVALGGSGRATSTAYAVICGGTTSTAAHQSIASVGTSGQVLTSNGAGALPTFEDASGGGAPAQTLYWKASDFDVLETNFAPLTQDNGSNNRMMVRAYDDTTEEFVNFSLAVPGEIDTSGTVTFRAFVYAATAVASRFVQLSFNHLPITSNESWDGAGTDEDSGDIALSGTQDQITVGSWTETVSNLGWAADDLVVCRLSRIAPSGTNLSGDLYLIGFEVEIPRA